jgi:hypothetical protein
MARAYPLSSQYNLMPCILAAKVVRVIGCCTYKESKYFHLRTALNAT